LLSLARWYDFLRAPEDNSMADATISIAEATLARLRELARWESISINEALDQAIKDQYDRKFWEVTNAGYAALRAEVEQERQSLEGTLMEGLDPSERWTERRDEVPPVDQGPAQ
jgi:hypothetical protein